MKLYRVYVFILFVSLSSYFVIFKYKWLLVENSSPLPILVAWGGVFCPNSEYFPTVNEIQCGDNTCILTADENYRDKAQAFLFYGTSIDKHNLPLPRVANGTRPIWALYHEESPLNQPFLLYQDGLDLFDFVSTFSRYSDLPMTLQGLPSLDLITDKKYFMDVKQKNKLLDNLAPVLYLSSHCDVPSERDKIVKELMKYVKVDSYGECLNNKKFDKEFDNKDYLNKFYHEHTLSIHSKYKFVLAIENAFCNDYITEKIWKAIATGAVPIYNGSPTMQDWLPNFNRSAILVNHFPNVKKLAEYILRVNSNDTLYNQYLEHKFDKVTNTALISNLTKRGEQTSFSNRAISNFGCDVCKYVHSKHKSEPWKFDEATVVFNKKWNFRSVFEYKAYLRRKKYFDCARPKEDFWVRHWKVGYCEARILKRLILEMNLKNINEVIYKRFSLKLCKNIWEMNYHN